jgi:hypothetical protein
MNERRAAMKRRRMIKFGIVGVLTLTAGFALAATRNTWHEMAGHACASGRNGDDVTFGQSGIGNNCNSGGCQKMFYCPVQMVKDSDLISPGPVTIGDAVIALIDNNESSNDFWCRPFLKDSYGGISVGPTQYTAAGHSPNIQRLVWWDPFSGLNLASSNYREDAMFFECQVPIRSNAYGTSSILLQKATFNEQNLP